MSAGPDSGDVTPPYDGVHRFVVAEFHGGPYHGRELRLAYPPPPCVQFPMTQWMAGWPRVATYVYIPTPDGGDVMAITDEEVRLAKCDVREVASRGMARLLYRYEVQRA